MRHDSSPRRSSSAQVSAEAGQAPSGQLNRWWRTHSAEQVVTDSAICDHVFLLLATSDRWDPALLEQVRALVAAPGRPPVDLEVDYAEALARWRAQRGYDVVEHSPAA